jgi:hypothetical protein
MWFRAPKDDVAYEAPSAGESLLGMALNMKRRIHAASTSFSQAASPAIAHNGLLWVSFALIVATLNVGIMGLKPLRFGVWFQSEPIFLGLMILSALAALMVWKLWRAGIDVFAAMRYRVMQIFTAFLAWNFITGALSEIPMRTWFGPPESGEGWLFYLSIWLYTLLVFTLLNHRLFIKALAIAVPASLALITAVQIFPDAENQIFKWADYLGFAVIFYFLSLPKLFSVVTHWWLKAALIAIGAVCLLLSGNFSAIFLVGIFTAVGAIHFALRKRKSAKWLLRIVIGCAVVIPTVWICIAWNSKATEVFCDTIVHSLSWYDKTFQPTGRVKEVIDVYKNTMNPENGELFNNGSLGTRILMNRAAYDFITSNVGSLLLGNGFGSYNDTLFRYSVTDGVKLYQPNAYANWYLVTGHAFHPHNAWIYMLVSSGFIGVMLWLAFSYGLLRHITAYTSVIIPGWLAYQCLSAVWFTVPIITVFFALALASTMHSMSPAQRHLPSKPWLPSLLLVVAAAYLIAATLHYRVATQTEAQLTQIQTSLPEANMRAIDDYGMGGMHQWWVAVLLGDYLNMKAAQNIPFKESDVAWFEAMQRMLQQASAESRKIARIDAYLLGAANDSMLLYAPTGNLWSATAERTMREWPEIALRFGLAEPTRTDILAQYFEYLIRHYQQTQNADDKRTAIHIITRLSRAILKRHPENAVAHWYYGNALIAESATEAEGLQHAIRAYQSGVANHVPIPDSFKAFMEQQTHVSSD